MVKPCNQRLAAARPLDRCKRENDDKMEHISGEVMDGTSSVAWPINITVTVGPMNGT